MSGDIFREGACRAIDLDCVTVPSPEARLAAKEALQVIARVKLTAVQRE